MWIFAFSEQGIILNEKCRSNNRDTSINIRNNINRDNSIDIHGINVIIIFTNGIIGDV
jgi:hypothetical protein